METSVLFLKPRSKANNLADQDKDGNIVHNTRFGATCSEYIKGNSWSGTYKTIFAFHPTGSRFTIDKNSYRIIDMINYFFSGWFTITIVTGDDLKFYTNYLKSMGTAYSNIRFGFHIDLHNSGVTKGKLFNQLLFPLTLSRWALVKSEYGKARTELLKLLDTYPMETLYMPAVLQTVDMFHNYYKVTFPSKPFYYDKKTFFNTIAGAKSTIPHVTDIVHNNWQKIENLYVNSYTFASIRAHIRNAYAAQALPFIIGQYVNEEQRSGLDFITIYNTAAEELFSLNNKVKVILDKYAAKDKKYHSDSIRYEDIINEITKSNQI